MMEQQDFEKHVKVAQNVSYWYKFYLYSKGCTYLILKFIILNDTLEKNTDFVYKIVSSDLLLLS